MGFDAGDSNLYRYVFNRATGATDPSGLVDFFLYTGGDTHPSKTFSFKAGNTDHAGTVTLRFGLSLLAIRIDGDRFQGVYSAPEQDVNFESQDELIGWQHKKRSQVSPMEEYFRRLRNAATYTLEFETGAPIDMRDVHWLQFITYRHYDKTGEDEFNGRTLVIKDFEKRKTLDKVPGYLNPPAYIDNGGALSPFYDMVGGAERTHRSLTIYDRPSVLNSVVNDDDRKKDGHYSIGQFDDFLVYKNQPICHVRLDIKTTFSSVTSPLGNKSWAPNHRVNFFDVRAVQSMPARFFDRVKDDYKFNAGFSMSKKAHVYVEPPFTQEQIRSWIGKK